MANQCPQASPLSPRIVSCGGIIVLSTPYLIPDFWQFPTVSMGLAPIMSIYQARFNRYLKSRGFLSAEEPKVWCFVGDGEMDEPESSGALSWQAAKIWTISSG